MDHIFLYCLVALNFAAQTVEFCRDFLGVPKGIALNVFAFFFMTISYYFLV